MKKCYPTRRRPNLRFIGCYCNGGDYSSLLWEGFSAFAFSDKFQVAHTCLPVWFGILPSASFDFGQADDEGEIVDPTPKIRAECMKTCPKQQKLYDACVNRITASGEGDCEAWFMELIACTDKCVGPKIFAATKGG